MILVVQADRGGDKRASNKTSNKASNTKIGRSSKALIYMIEFQKKFGTGALHPLQSNFNSLVSKSWISILTLFRHVRAEG